MAVISRSKFDQITNGNNIPKVGSELGSRYLSVDLHFQYVVKMPKHNIWSYELCYWLEYYIGKNHKDWEWWYGYSAESSYGLKFEFKNEEDKVKFILRWL